MTDETRLYKQYKNMIKSIARKYSSGGMLDYYEVEGQGNLIFVETLRKYNEHKAKFSTYLYVRLDKGLMKYMARNIKNSWAVLDENHSYHHDFEDRVCFNESCNTLSKDTRDIINDIINDITIYKNSPRLKDRNINEIRQLVEA
jgi:hypothetical protein